MVTYKNENGSIIKVEILQNATIRASIGAEKQLSLISETETEMVYQWQKFSLEKGMYEDDMENNEVVRIDEKEYIPKIGRVVVHKITQESIFSSLGKQLAETKLENMKLSKFISNIANENAKTKIEIMKLKKEVNG